MPFDASFLTRKVGPLPVWAYAAGGGAVLSGFLLYNRGKSKLSGASTQPESPYASSAQGQLNYPPTVVVTPASTPNTTGVASTAPSPGSTRTVIAGSGVPGGGNPTGIFRTPDASQVITTVPKGTALTVLGPPVTGQSQTFGSTTSTSWTPVDINGAQGYVWSPFVGTSSGGGGGGGTLATAGYTGRGPWDYFAPFQPSQYVDAGRGGIGEVSRHTGIPAVRLQSLNYHLRGANGYRPGIVRIA